MRTITDINNRVVKEQLFHWINLLVMMMMMLLRWVGSANNQIKEAKKTEVDELQEGDVVLASNSSARARARARG